MNAVHYGLIAALFPIYIIIGVVFARRIHKWHENPSVLTPVLDTLLWPTASAAALAALVVVTAGMLLLTTGMYLLKKAETALIWVNKKILGDGLPLQ